jgi:hypothetical protein
MEFPELKLPDGTVFKPKRIWLPAENQLIVMPNDSWLHSAWIGIFYSFFYLPFMIFNMILLPLGIGLFKVCVLFFVTLYRGFTGSLDAYNLPPGLMMMVRVREE